MSETESNSKEILNSSDSELGGFDQPRARTEMSAKNDMNKPDDSNANEVAVPRLVRLGRPHGGNCADEARELGLKIGDIIRGKEGGEDWWNEARLTLLWIGDSVCVWRKQWRNKGGPSVGWYDEGEAANWTLSCREWFLETND